MTCILRHLRRAALPFALLLALPAGAVEPVSPLEAWEADPSMVFDAADVDLEDFMYVARPIVVFANSPRDPAYAEQIEQLLEEFEPLEERDVVLVVDADPAAGSDIRERLRPRGFMMVLIGKDGQVKLRKPFPQTVRELSRSIDKMPERQREYRERG
jgi:hypothetical protein